MNESKKLLMKTAKKGNVSQEDANKIIEFIEYYSTLNQLSNGSISKYYYALKAFAEYMHEIGYIGSTLNEAGVLKLLSWINNTSWSEDTRADYYDRFTRWWGWCADRAKDEGKQYDEKAYRLLVDPRHKKVYKINKNRQTKKGIISQEDALKLISSEPNLCYKVFFACLYEGGMRSGEAFSLLLRDVEEHNNGTYTLHIRTSKTQKRPVPIMLLGKSYLRLWIKQHPLKEDMDAKLFLNTEDTPLNNFAANKELKRLLRVTGLNRERVTLHSFRHSRATELASKGLTEFELCRLFGWRIGSKMPATYIREGALDVRSALKKASGIPVEVKQAPIIGTTCLHCETQNDSGSDYCTICRMPLDELRLQRILESEKRYREHVISRHQELINELIPVIKGLINEKTN